MALKGIDVSYHNGTIDWNKVKADGINFAIIRAGYGTKTMDKEFLKNIVGATQAGIRVGIYWFIYAADTSGAISNAEKCHELIKPYKNSIEVGVWADWEYDSDKRNPQTKDGRTAIVKAFCEHLNGLGYDIGVYANPDYLSGKFGDLSVYPLWLAKYGSSVGKYDPDIWQFTSSGKVNGISGKVDMNYLYREIGEQSESKKETSSNNPYPEPTRLLYWKTVKMRGNDVKWLQFELIRHNCLSETNSKGKTNVDGIFGADTDAALRIFQSLAEITVDGKCGAVTRSKLKE